MDSSELSLVLLASIMLEHWTSKRDRHIATVPEFRPLDGDPDSRDGHVAVFARFHLSSRPPVESFFRA